MAEPRRQAKADVKSAKTAEHEDEKQTVGRTELTKRGEELTEKLDDLLEEIDEVLEDNAEEFVKAYIQRGGQ
ncbi:MAG TPA: ubiquitin-like protein Pup [Methylomirabilota bacterium]|jgi:ubiquitin-like protein Pup